jgi:hypothetical protein
VSHFHSPEPSALTVTNDRNGVSSPIHRVVSWTELAFADHPLVPVHFVFDPIMRRIALAKQNANDFKAALGGMVDTPLWEEFHRLADVVFVL